MQTHLLEPECSKIPSAAPAFLYSSSYPHNDQLVLQLPTKLRGSDPWTGFVLHTAVACIRTNAPN